MVSSIAMLVAIFAPIITIVKNIRERVTPFRAVINGMLTGIVGALAVMVLGQMAGINAFDELFKAVDSMAKYMAETPGMTEALTQYFGGNVSEDQVLDTITAVYNQAIKLLPACLCIIAITASYVEYILLSKIMRPGGIAPIPMTKMQEFDLPRRLITVWCLIYIIALLMSQSDMFADNIIFINLSLLFDFAFCLQGVSVIFMFCHTRKIPRVIPGILMILIVVFGMFKNIIMLLGFVDLLFGLKYRMKQKF